MLRWLALGICIIGAAAWLVLGAGTKSQVTLADAHAYPMMPGGEMFMVTLTLTNTGGATTLTGVSSPSADEVFLMNPSAPNAPLVVPGSGTAALAMDGAHIMLRAADFPEGSFLPLVLEFDGRATVTTRVNHAAPDGMAGMRHGIQHGVEVTPAPRITAKLPEAPDPAGFDVTLALEHFRFVQTPDGTAHVPNEGHAHVYLNGLKLGRAYGPHFAIGALSPGDYELRVGLNTHDHRPYVADGKAVESVVKFTLP